MIINLKKIDKEFMDKKGELKKVKEKDIYSKIKNTNIFQLEINENNEMDLYVGENFYIDENKDLKDNLIKTIMSTIYFHNSTKKIKEILFNVINSEELIELFPYILSINDNQDIKLFNLSLKKHNLEGKFLKLFVSSTINKEEFQKMINSENISKNDKNTLVVFFEKINNIFIENKLQEIEISALDDSTTMSGNIFQLLCGKLLFNKNSNFYYNNNGGGLSGGLYPDILFKFKDALFICDTKCYQDDNDISPHKEFFYNILLSDIMKQTYGILFSYDITSSDKLFEIKKCYKLEGHLFFLIALNMKKIIENYMIKNEYHESLSSLIAEKLITSIEEIEDLFHANKKTYNETELIEYKIFQNIIDFVNN